MLDVIFKRGSDICLRCFGAKRSTRYSIDGFDIGLGYFEPLLLFCLCNEEKVVV